MSPIHLSPLIAIHLSPSLAGGVRLSGFLRLPIWLVVSGSPDVSISFVSLYSKSGLWCPALCMSPIHLFPLIAIHLSPILAGSVRLSGCLQLNLFPLIAIHLSPNLAGGVRLWMSPIHLFPLIAIHLSPSLAGGVRLSGCFQFICLPL